MLAVQLAVMLALCGALAAAPALAAKNVGADGLVAVPPLVSRVTDLTDTLTPAQKSALEQTLASFEQSKGSQIAVLMLPSTKPEEIEQYGIRVADQWKLGRKGVDDGLILIIAKDDHRARIEVGRGLEGVVPDVIASRVIREIIGPQFIAGDYYGGINAGVEQLIGLVNGEALPPPPPSARRAQRGHGGGGNFDNMLTIGFILVFVVGGLLVRVLGRVIGSGAVGVIAGIAAFILIGGLFAAIGAGILGFIAALLFGSGFGGRGFGIGGGGFGGGGASGSW
jgi:uncharacterized protein